MSVNQSAKCLNESLREGFYVTDILQKKNCRVRNLKAFYKKNPQKN